jgi:prepilin peptidase CpaA
MNQIAVVIMGLGIAVVCDWKTRRIPNLLTLPMIACGLAIHTTQSGLDGFIYSVAGLVVGISFLYLPFKWGGVGGGDVKLMGAIGSLLGPLTVLYVFLAGGIFGGLISLLSLIKTGRTREVFEGVRQKIAFLIVTRQMLPEDKAPSSTQALRIPYAFAIACGAVFVLFVMN